MGALRRWSRPARHALAFGALRVLVGGLRRLPLPWSLALGAGLGRLIGLFSWRESQQMRRRLAQALDNPPRISACWADLGRRFVEWINAARMVDRIEVDLTALEPIAPPYLVATCHLGNWELMAMALARKWSFSAIGARTQSGPLFRWLTATRAEFGVEMLAPGAGARAARRALQTGRSVSIFVDQHTRERSRTLSFFGRAAPTPITFERLLKLSNARAAFAWTVRLPDGRHRVVVEPLPLIDPLAAATARIETLVRAHPTQWIWQHNRW